MKGLKEIPPHRVGEWGWYASEDGEYFREGPEAAREAIIEVARDTLLGEDEYEPGRWRLSFTIAYCQKKYIDLASHFEIEEFLERVDDKLVDDLSPEFDQDSPLKEIKTEAALELQTLVRNTIREWQKHHGYDMPVHTFASIKDEEHVLADYPDETTQITSKVET